jgi:hypothetical protein
LAVTLQELHVEFFFPADDTTERAARSLVARVDAARA